MNLRLLFLTFIIIALTLLKGSASAQSVGNWTNTGPVNFPVNSSGQVNGLGRVSQIKFHPTNSQKIYAVSASGGLYITSNNGASWTPISGTQTLPQSSMSSMCINYSNDNTLYVCLGDANYYSNSYGVYKSYDAGATWFAANSGIGANMAVEMLMDPSDTSKLVAATKGGIYKTTNGGSSWAQVQSGIFRDMKAKPVANSKTLYAATATAFYVSTDFGTTWAQITSGVTPPTGNGGMRIAVSANDTSRVYLATTGSNGVVFKSTNSGTSFSTVYSSTSQCLVCYDATTTSGSQGDYNFDLNANPVNANELLLIAHNVWRSTDAGVTWSKRTSWWNECHTDMHHIEWNPYNNAQIWNANDGGVWMSIDTTATVWNPRCDGVAANEIYHAAQSPLVRNLISIGTQDNGELYYSSLGWRTNRGGDWTARCNMDYRNNGTVWYLNTGNRRILQPLGSDQGYGIPYAATNNGRIEFVSGLPNTAFLGKDTIYRSINTNATTPSWTLIKASTSAMREMASCHADSNILYVLESPNVLYRSDDALAPSPTWTTITTPSSVSVTGSITTSRRDANLVFLAAGNQVYRSTNKGATWTNITGTGLSGMNIRKIIHDDYSTKQRLFVNAGAYVHFKDSTTTAWTNHSVGAGLPTIANATDFMIYNDGTSNSILRLSTYGRGMWECNINDNMPPTADFTTDKIDICIGDSVHFSQLINGGFTSLVWTFTGGSPASSTAANPVVQYAMSGIYPVKLVATNAYGTDSITKVGYILVGQGQTTQVAEGFEGAAFPPNNWTLKNTSGSNWQLATVGGYGSSSKSIYFDNFDLDAGGGHDIFRLPKMDLSNVANARLRFDLAYAPYSSGYPDSLQIKVSSDCGATWTNIYTKTGTTLATTAAYTAGLYVPTSSQWRTDSLSLRSFVGGSLLVSFENIGHFGQGLYIDNVNLGFLPLAKFGVSDTAICQNVSVQFSDSSKDATSWQWSFPGGSPANSTVQNPTVSYTSAGFYLVTLFAKNATGNDTLVKTSFIHVYAAPIVNLGNDTTLCPGTSLSLNAGNSGSSFLFSNAATTQVTSISSVGTYTARVISAQGCIGRDTIIISAATQPIVNLGNDTAICPGTSVTLSAGNPGSSFLFSTSATTSSITVSSFGSYSVAVKNVQGCIGRDTINITQAPTPSVNLGNDTVLCSGASLTLNAGNPGSSYLFSNAATTATISVSTAGTYSVAVTNSSSCVGRDTIVITTGTNPVVNLGNDTTLCPTISFTINAGNTGSSFLYNTSATTQSITIASAGTYSVRVTNLAGCIGRDTIVISSATAPTVFLGNDTTLCPGKTLTLDAGNIGSTYLYSTSATTRTISVSSSGSYSVAVTNVSGCIGRDTIIIFAGTNPLVNLGKDTTLCVGDTIRLDAGNVGSGYLFSNGDKTRYSAVWSAGSYSVAVTNGQNCVGRDTIVLSTATKPVVNLGRDTTLCPGSSITLNAGNPGSSYLYSTAATSQSIIVTSAGSYSVRVTNAQKCIGRDTIIIAAGTIPNATITATGATLTVGSVGVSYQWYLNGTVITGAVNNTFIATKSGTYKVVVVNASGCTGTSPNFSYVAANVVNALLEAGYELFPNPTEGIFTFRAKHVSGGIVTLNCFDATGKKVAMEQINLANGNAEKTIDWSNLARGIYAVTISQEGKESLRSTISVR
ncbi:MAG: PKD domain-containing protein [Chitinophagaceae bacterium]